MGQIVLFQEIALVRSIENGQLRLTESIKIFHGGPFLDRIGFQSYPCFFWNAIPTSYGLQRLRNQTGLAQQITENGPPEAGELKAEIGKVLEAGDHPPTLELRRTGRSEGSMSEDKKRKTERQVWIL
jgi:hypothetical protein